MSQFELVDEGKKDDVYEASSSIKRMSAFIALFGLGGIFIYAAISKDDFSPLLLPAIGTLIITAVVYMWGKAVRVNEEIREHLKAMNNKVE